MKKLSIIVVLFAIAMQISFQQALAGFNMTIAPAKKVFQMNRGDSKEYIITFRNDDVDAEYRARVRDYYYTPSGDTKSIERKDIADVSQALSSWITLGVEKFQAKKGIINEIPVTINVPKNASYGDHYATVLVEKVDNTLEAKSGFSIGVTGAIATVIILKINGGEVIKTGNLVDYEVQTQEKARNTANVVVKFSNTGNQFYTIVAEVEIFRQKNTTDPFRVLRQDALTFPNVTKEIKIPVGDLGDDMGEDDYLARLNIYEFENGVKTKLLANAEKTFHYYVPLITEGVDRIIVQKELVSNQDVVSQTIREFGLYFAGFILLVIVLIRVLFFSGKSVDQKRRKS